MSFVNLFDVLENDGVGVGAICDILEKSTYENIWIINIRCLDEQDNDDERHAQSLTLFEETDPLSETTCTLNCG